MVSPDAVVVLPAAVVVVVLCTEEVVLVVGAMVVVTFRNKEEVNYDFTFENVFQDRIFNFLADIIHFCLYTNTAERGIYLIRLSMTNQSSVDLLHYESPETNNTQRHRESEVVLCRDFHAPTHRLNKTNQSLRKIRALEVSVQTIISMFSKNCKIIHGCLEKEIYSPVGSVIS